MPFTPGHAHRVAHSMRKVQNDTSKMIAVLHLCEMFQADIPNFNTIEFYRECGFTVNDLVRITMRESTNG